MNINKNDQSHIGCMKKMRRLGCALLGAVSVLIGGYLILRGAGAFLIVADELVPAKAIVVLSGGTESRMTEALRIYEDGLADIIILTETGERITDSDYLYSFDMRIQLMSNGVPSGNILITDLKVGSTVDEARAVKEVMTAQQYPSAIIVTDPYHSRRTRKIFNDIFSDTSIELYIRPVRESWFNSRTWFLSPRGWQFTILEYTKLIGYLAGIGEK